MQRHKPKLILAVAIAAVWVLRNLRRRSKRRKALQTLKEDARRRNQKVLTALEMSISLPELSSSLREKILKSSILELQSSLSDRTLTCEQIFLAYTHQVRTASAANHCILDIDIESGLAQARVLDNELQSGSRRSNLHGIPISVKDFIATKSLASTYGCASLCENYPSEDAHLIKILKSKGALIYIKSAMTQNASTYETINLISGVTTNPHNSLRSCGGSSGGDAVLVSTSGTCLGLGTDLGGSLRFPSLSCGVYTLKPSSARLSRSAPHTLQDLPGVRNAWGPIARSTDDLRVFYQEVLSEPPSKNLPWIKWRQDVYERNGNLKIGYCLGSEYWPIPDCMKRAVIKAKEILEEKGHSLVEFVLENEIKEVTERKIAVYAYDQRDSNRLAGEEPLNLFYKFGSAMSMPNWLRRPYAKYVEYRYGEKESFYYKSLNVTTYSEYLENIMNIKLFKRRFFEKVKALDIDILLFPCPFPAIPHYSSSELLPGFSYFAMFNILDCPVGSVPMGVVEAHEQHYPLHDENWSKTMQEVMKNSVGLPIGLQVVGLPYSEEVTLRVMKELEAKLD